VKGLSWFEAKTSIIRDAVRAYSAQIYTLDPVKLYVTAYLLLRIKKVSF
jgi:hypothetical protein